MRPCLAKTAFVKSDAFLGAFFLTAAARDGADHHESGGYRPGVVDWLPSGWQGVMFSI